MPHRVDYSVTPLETLRRFGPLKALQLLVLRCLRAHVIVLMARAPKGTDQSANRDLALRKAAPDDKRLFETAGFGPAMLAAKLAEGAGWIALDRERLIAWNFLGAPQSAIADWLALRSDRATAIWSTGTWVHRDYRGRGLMNQLSGLAGDWCLANGYDELLSWVELTNQASLRATLKLGCHEIGRIVALRLPGTALLHDGRRWHLGRWSRARPLVLSIDRIRRDGPGGGQQAIS